MAVRGNGDLLLWPTQAMQVNEFYRERWAGRFDCILADEYQDVNHAQYSWLHRKRCSVALTEVA